MSESCFVCRLTPWPVHLEMTMDSLQHVLHAIPDTCRYHVSHTHLHEGYTGVSDGSAEQSNYDTQCIVFGFYPLHKFCYCYNTLYDNT